MAFPLNMIDISVLLAITSIILLATSEIISPQYGRTNLVIEKRRLRLVALAMGVLFLFTVVIRVYEIILTL